MKTGLFLATVVQLAAANPLWKRDTVTVTQGAIVYVNQYGQPVSTSYPAPTPAPAPASPHVKSHIKSNSFRKVNHAQHKHHHHKAGSAVGASKVNTPHKGAGASGGAKTGGMGIVYSPYNADGTCKTMSQVSSDFDKITGYSNVRIYGTDCDQVNTVGSAAQAKGMKIMAGIFDISDVASEVSLIASGVNKNWDLLHSVTVGNELVNSGQASVPDVVSAIGSARSALRAAGYSGPVVTVDTFNTVIDNPELCHASDFPAVNAHAFFDNTIAAPKAGGWLEWTVKQVEKACGQSPTVTETGWPHQGQANGLAVPGVQQQNEALSSIRSFFNQDVFLFTAYDDLWKSDFPGSFGAEKYWGILPGQ